MTAYEEKFQQLLRELFQFDCADLDFGIYRIMNYKREAIVRFIAEDLPKAVAAELECGVLAEQSRVADDLKEVVQQIEKILGRDALDAEGNLLAAFRVTPLGKRYLGLKARAMRDFNRESLLASIFNHLYTFFNRYYQEGDFISRRRYSKRRKYAIPYNGEEVYLYWANSDQYYVKTAEHFHDYNYKDRHGETVHFKIVAASVEQNNVKGEKRFFQPLLKEIERREANKEIVIPFEYRPLTEQEDISYGRKNQQEAIIAQALAEIPRLLNEWGWASPALTAEHHKNSEGAPVTLLEHHLRQYTRRNTSDFFIHKDLQGFLSGELDFYLKNEALNLDEMETVGEERAEGWFQVMRVIKAVGGRIIDFLGQIESFQKMLWEKRKFVVETQYCIAVGGIAADFYPGIAACEAQWIEWKELFHIDENQTDLFNSGMNRIDRRIAFIESHPSLVLDTKHFDPDFVDRLLAGFADLDEMCDGLLVHSENFQALNLMLEKYRQKVKCIHIDPPYNTQTSGFLYKNEYQHSSWLAMMHNRITAGVLLMSQNGAFLCHIDENEYEVLHLLFTNIGLPDGGTIVWDKKNPMLGRQGIATQHEYILWRTWNESSVYLRPTNIHIILDKLKSLINIHGRVNDQVRREFNDWITNCDDLTGGEKAYRLIDDNGFVFRGVAMGAPEPRTDSKFFIPLIHPITKKKCPIPPNGWSRSPETLKELIEKGEILFGEDETVQPQKKVFLTENSKRQLSSVISDASRGKADMDNLKLDFPYCHPVSLYENLLGAAAAESEDMVLDFFAGSGTTGHAAINLNREDGGNRKFILVEMGQYFDSVLLPRIKKVSFSPEWKDGKPKRMAAPEEVDRGPRIVKYIRLESYEDALDNIEFDETHGQTAFKFDDYFLKYILKWETKASETLLNIEKLERPFNYKLHIHDNGRTREKIADLPETFNYLLGLHVQTRQALDDNGRRYLVYRGLIARRRVAVIWRETANWQKADLERDKNFVIERKLIEDADEVFVNGDSFIPNARALEPLFKARMFAPMEA